MNRTSLFYTVALLATAMPATSAAAQTKTFCSEPVTPFCANRPGVFDDDTARARCRDDVASYATKMAAFIDCLGKQQQEATARIKQVEDRFACMADGNDHCP